MADLVPDVLEKILITLDVKDLIRCKGVCKFWHSFISSSLFVTAHMNHCYNNDRNNTGFGNRRILMSMTTGYKVNGCYSSIPSYSALLGSSNGLVCISNSTYEIFVANPSTREVKKLQRPLFDDNINSISVECWGFGYDSSTDDYKVVLVHVYGNNQTCFQVLSLKSNVWKVLGKQKYTCEMYNECRAGTLCNGALHWFMKDQNNKSVIVSFDLFKEVFKEIPHPKDSRYTRKSHFLAIIDECLCIYPPILETSFGYCLYIWNMKNYDVQESWVLLNRINNDVAHYLENLNDYIPQTIFCSNDISRKDFLRYFHYPIFVQSLVSPHVYEGRKQA